MRERPRVLVTLALEATRGHIVFVCESYEDELRLRSWLRSSGAFRSLPTVLERLLDDLDQLDAEGEDVA
jgi:hypothetical protein